MKDKDPPTHAPGSLRRSATPAGTPSPENTVFVRLTRKYAEMIDGIDLSGYVVGDRIRLFPREAALLVAEGWAVPTAISAKTTRRPSEIPAPTPEVARLPEVTPLVAAGLAPLPEPTPLSAVEVAGATPAAIPEPAQVPGAAPLAFPEVAKARDAVPLPAADVAGRPGTLPLAGDEPGGGETQGH